MGVKAVSCEKRTRLGCFVSSWLELNRHFKIQSVLTHKNHFFFLRHLNMWRCTQNLIVKFVVNNVICICSLIKAA